MSMQQYTYMFPSWNYANGLFIFNPTTLSSCKLHDEHPREGMEKQCISVSE